MQDAKRVQNKLPLPDEPIFFGWSEMDKHLDSMEKYADLLEAEGY